MSMTPGWDRYATRLQAEKAVAAGHGSRLSDKVMLGVQKVQDEVSARRDPNMPCMLLSHAMYACLSAGRQAGLGGGRSVKSVPLQLPCSHLALPLNHNLYRNFVDQKSICLRLVCFPACFHSIT